MTGVAVDTFVGLEIRRAYLLERSLNIPITAWVRRKFRRFLFFRPEQTLHFLKSSHVVVEVTNPNAALPLSKIQFSNNIPNEGAVNVDLFVQD